MGTEWWENRRREERRRRRRREERRRWWWRWRRRRRWWWRREGRRKEDAFYSSEIEAYNLLSKEKCILWAKRMHSSENEDRFQNLDKNTDL